ncbi:hypothetical protein D3C72_1580990 [compost metagenome]
MARHIEQPGWRHSKPAAVRTSARPSRSAWALTAPDPGTTMALTPAATLRPRTTLATARRSSMRPLVQEPMKTCWIGVPASAAPGCRCVYASARSTERCSASSSWSSGNGIWPETGSTWSGLVPQVT